MDRRFGAVDLRFEAVDRRFDSLDQRMGRQFVWLVGIQITVLMAVISTLLVD